MLGSGERATAFLGDLQQFALATPFEFPQLVSASQRMLAFGFAAGDVLPLLTDIGNAASASPQGFAQGLDRITLALGQMTAKGRVQGDELLQLQEAGINTGQIFAIMARQTGKTVPQLQKMQQAGKLLPATFITAFRTFSQTRFGGLMEKQSQTFTGALSNITDGLRGATATAFSPLFEWVRKLAVQFAAFLQTPQFAAFTARVQGLVAGAIPSLQAALDWFLTNGPKAWDWLSTTVPAAIAAFQTKWGELEPTFTALKGWLADTLPVASASLADTWNSVLRPALDNVFAVLAPVAGAFGEVAGAAANEAFRNLGPTLVGIGAAVLTLQVPTLVAAGAALTTMAAAAGPLILLAGALGLIAYTLSANWPDVKAIVGDFFSALGSGVQQAIQGLKVLAGLLIAVSQPALLKQAGITLQNVALNAQQGVSLFDIAAMSKKPVFGANLPEPAAVAAGGAPAAGGGTVNVNLNGATISSQLDVDALLGQVAAAAEDGAARAAESAGTTTLVGGS